MAATEELPITSPVELTERELALAQGTNPDAVATETTVPSAEVSAEPVSTEAVPSGVGTDAASSTEAKSWITDEHRQLATSYGFNDDDLKDLTSADEFRRATRLIDRQLTSSGQAFLAANQPNTQQTATPQTTQATTQAVANAQAAAKLAKIDVGALKAKGYDDDTIALISNQNNVIDEVESLREERKQEREKFEQLNTSFSQWQQQQAQYARAAQVNAFHDAVDSLGDGRFGKTVSQEGRPVQLSPQEDALRRKLYETAETLAVGIVARAKAVNAQPQLPPLPVLLRRAQQLAFGDDIRAEAQRDMANKLSEQSKKRRPVASTRATQYVAPSKDGPKTVNDLVKEVSNAPAVVEAWNQMQQASGAV